MMMRGICLGFGLPGFGMDWFSGIGRRSIGRQPSVSAALRRDRSLVFRENHIALKVLSGFRAACHGEAEGEDGLPGMTSG